MKSALKMIFYCIPLFWSVNALSDEGDTSTKTHEVSQQSLIIEKTLKLDDLQKVLATYWFEGKYEDIDSSHLDNYLNLKAIEIQTSCEEPNKCDSTVGLYQAFSNSFANYQQLLERLPNIHFKKNDKYCPLVRCSFSKVYYQQSQLYDLDRVMDDWKFTANLMSDTIKQSYKNQQPAFIYIRFLGKSKLELNIQLKLDTDNNIWVINNVLEVKRHYNSYSYEYLNTYSVRFFGDERALFKGNEYWWKLYELGYGLSCQATQSNQPALSTFGNIISFTGNYNKCVIDTNHGD